MITRAERIGEVTNWLRTRLVEIQMLVETSNRLINSALSEALGPRGQPGSPELLAYVARRLGEVYGRLLTWTNDFYSVSADTEFERAIQLSSNFSRDVINSLESFPAQIDGAMNEAEAARTRGEAYNGEVIVAINIPINAELDAEMERLRDLIESGQIP